MFRNILFFTAIFFILNTNNTYSQPNILKTFNNMVIHEKAKDLPNLELINKKGNRIIFNDFSSKITLLNFWATWCAPCKEEMPSLDQLQSQKNLNNLKIFPINVGQDNLEKASKFFEDLGIDNLKIYFDSQITLAKKFGLRGVPTTILINKDGYEFARIVGSIDFKEKKFVEWLASHN